MKTALLQGACLTLGVQINVYVVVHVAVVIVLTMRNKLHLLASQISFETLQLKTNPFIVIHLCSCRQALEIRETTFGKSHPSVATALNNLAVVLCLQVSHH